MSAPYVPSVYVPGQQNERPNDSVGSAPAYAPNNPRPSANGAGYNVAGQQHALPHAPVQQPQPTASQPYVPGQFQTMHQSVNSYGQMAQQPANIYGVTSQQPQTQAYTPGQSVANNYSTYTPQAPSAPGASVQQHQQGAYDPNDPDGERGILETGGKIALGIGAAAVAYSAYTQFQQHQHGQHNQPPQLVYGAAENSSVYGGAAQPPAFEQPQRKGVLTIHLDRLANLANKDLLSKSDPYVQLSIEQDNWVRDIDYGRQISGRKTDDLNPVYNEVFHFNLPTLRNMVLKVKVLDDDGGFTSDDSLGQCKIKLWELNLSQFPQPVERVIDHNLFSRNGMCYLRLAYSG